MPSPKRRRPLTTAVVDEPSPLPLAAMQESATAGRGLLSVRAAGRRYMLVVFLIWLPVGMLIAPMVLLMLERGLDLPTIALVGVVYSLTTATLELPTGGLADVTGRRGVLALSSLVSLLGLVAFGLATTVGGYVVAALLRGMSRALSSGPPEAWYVDTVHATAGGDASLMSGLARGEAAGSLGLAVGTIFGGVVPLVLPSEIGSVPALAVPVFVAAAVEAVRLVVTILGMPEPPHERQRLNRVLLAVPATISSGVRLGIRDAVLVRLLLVTGALGVALASVELLTPSWLATVTGSRESAGATYAFAAALGFSADAAGSSLSPRLVTWLGSPPKAAQLAYAVAAAGIALLAISVLGSGTPAIIGAGAAYCLMFAALGATAAPQADLLHRRVDSHERATMLSVQSLVLQVVGAAGAVAMGYLAAHHGPAIPLAAAALAMLAATAAFMRLPTGQAPQAP